MPGDVKVCSTYRHIVRPSRSCDSRLVREVARGGRAASNQNDFTWGRLVGAGERHQMKPTVFIVIKESLL